MAAAWPGRAGDPYADRTNAIPKYVASRTLSQDDLTWSGSTLLPADDAIGAMRELRAREGKGLQVWGSPSIAAQLIEHDLVGEYQFMIEPVLLGGGKRVFPEDGQARPLELVSTTTSSTGVLICSCSRNRSTHLHESGRNAESPAECRAFSIFGFGGSDEINGGDGSDYLSGGDGTDVCTSGETANDSCKQVVP